MQEVNDFLTIIDSYIGGSSWFAFLLLGTGLFFTFYLKFPQIRFFGHAIKTTMGKYDLKGAKGDATHFQALSTALSGTVGTGNIAGVAFAIHLGGPPALFWMLMTAAIGMTTKFVEVTISHKYREITSDGTIAGGAMYYMKNAHFLLFGKKINMTIIGIIFAIATVLSSFGTGSLPQINSIANSLLTTFGLEKWITGLVLAFILALIIIGGIKRIVTVSEKLVPAMAIIYFLGALGVIFYNIENIIPSFISIFSDLFTGTAATGGFVGATISIAFNKGVARGLFSNESGQGSAPIAHSAARSTEPLSEGMVAILEPFIDTIIICFLTGLVVLSSGVWKEKYDNIFQYSDMIVLADSYTENPENTKKIMEHITQKKLLPTFTGNLLVRNGKIQNAITVIHSRSVAEDILIYKGTEIYTGEEIFIENGLVKNYPLGLEIRGKSLLHSAPLTTEAFKKSYFGEFGKYVISIGLLLFAFSTAVSWSYYGDRAINFLFGKKYIFPYHCVYVIGFFLASITDTTIIWTFSGITIALMTIPNLIGILWLRKEMPQAMKSYQDFFKKSFPDKKHPRFY
ncbi:MAG: amino acid carrier protein [Chitinophagaceae bacterium]|nr:amino acid carrier protein [Chitinophagaceae bacterium]